MSEERKTKYVAGDSSSSVEQIRMCIIARDYKVIKAVDLVSFSSSFLGLFNDLNTVSPLRVNYQLLTCCDWEQLLFFFLQFAIWAFLRNIKNLWKQQNEIQETKIKIQDLLFCVCCVCGILAFASDSLFYCISTILHQQLLPKWLSL